MCLKTQKIVIFPLIYKIQTAEAIIRISVFIICCICGFRKETHIYLCLKDYIMLRSLPWSGHHHSLPPQTLGFSLSVLLTVQFSCWSPERSCLTLNSHYSLFSPACAPSALVWPLWAGSPTLPTTDIALSLQTDFGLKVFSSLFFSTPSYHPLLGMPPFLP